MVIIYTLAICGPAITSDTMLFNKFRDDSHISVHICDFNNCGIEHVLNSSDVSRHLDDNLVQSEEDRHLNNHLQTASCRRYTVLFIYGHGLFLHLHL